MLFILICHPIEQFLSLSMVSLGLCLGNWPIQQSGIITANLHPYSKGRQKVKLTMEPFLW